MKKIKIGTIEIQTKVNIDKSISVLAMDCENNIVVNEVFFVKEEMEEIAIEKMLQFFDLYTADYLFLSSIDIFEQLSKNIIRIKDNIFKRVENTNFFTQLA